MVIFTLSPVAHVKGDVGVRMPPIGAVPASTLMVLELEDMAAAPM